MKVQTLIRGQPHVCVLTDGGGESIKPSCDSDSSGPVTVIWVIEVLVYSVVEGALLSSPESPCVLDLLE